LLTILRRSEEAFDQAELSMELDPFNPLIMGLYVVVLRQNNNCDEALEYINTAIALDPDHNFLKGQLRWVLECFGDYDQVFKLLKEAAYSRWEKFGVAELLETTYQERGWIALMEKLSRLHESVMAQEFHNLPWLLYKDYLAHGEYDRAMDYLEMVYENHSQDGDININIPYQSAKNTFESLKDNPRYVEFLKKMNLPLN
jgi:tetratricopeptide (TPR) repeat protein